jgi:hypothetical protein
MRQVQRSTDVAGQVVQLLTIERELGWAEDLGFNSLCLS